MKTLRSRAGCTLQFDATALTRCPHTLLLALLVTLAPIRPTLADVCSAPTFAPAPTFSAGTNSVFVAVGDFNGDGKPDLAAANQGYYDPNSSTYTNGSVSVLLGKGDGTFQTAVSYRVGTNPVFVAVGDFNGDGKADLAVVNQGFYDSNGQNHSSISVLLGKGDGTFQDATEYGAGTGARAVAVGDFNGDGKLDLAVANNGDDFNMSDSGVSVLLGKGDGTFENAVKYDAESYPTSIAVGDFNGDGKLDLVVGGFGPNGISVLLGKGDGTFQGAVESNAGTDANSVAVFSMAVGDFNGDGKLDLAVANKGRPLGGRFVRGSSVSVILGKGDGTFQNAISLSLVSPFSVAVGDFNGDGIPDLAVANEIPSGSFGTAARVSVLLGKGDGTFQPITLNLNIGSCVAVGDFNGDGKPDLVCASGDSISVVLNLGVSVSPQPSFTPTVAFPSGDFASSAVVGDFNGDGKPDLATPIYHGIQSNGIVAVFLAKGDGTFQAPSNYEAGPYPRSVAVGDFNLDGKLDLAVANYGSYDASSDTYTNSSISVLLGKGDGTFQAAVNYNAGTNPLFVAVGDFNGDGKPDVAVVNENGPGASVLLGRGDGTFQAFVSYDTGAGSQSVAVGDFNGDGKSDLAVANLGLFDLTSQAYANSGISVLLGKGDGTFQTAVHYSAGTNPVLVAVGDFNGDDKPDLAVAYATSQNDSSISVWLGRGDGTFQTAVEYGAGTNARSVAVGDLNGDGKSDLLVVGNAIWQFFGNGDGTFQAAVRYPGGNIFAVAVGDFNGDSKLDWATISDPDSIVVLATVWLNTSCFPGPNLAIARTAAALTVSWPFPSAGYVLETATSLRPTSWKPAGATPVKSQGRLELTTPATQSQGYFRLRKP